MEIMVHSKGWLFAGVMAASSVTNVGTFCCISSQSRLQENVLMLSALPLKIDECSSEQIFLNSHLMILLNDLIIFAECCFTIV